MGAEQSERVIVPLFFERQHIHLLGAAAMLLLARQAAAIPGFLEGAAWGLSANAWYWLAIWAPIGHQVWVWLWWRAELHHGWVSRTFRGKGFRIYAAGFGVFSLARVLALIALALATSASLDTPPRLLTAIALVFSVLVLYLMYSVQRYFSFTRALGADHFHPRYRAMGLEKRGTFAWVDNGMYVFGLLALWLPGLFLASAPALVAGVLSHVYIWVHYFATEKPDMARIYGE